MKPKVYCHGYIKILKPKEKLTMTDNNDAHANSKQILFNSLKELTPDQFKAFYSLFVHQWANNRFFISDQNLFNLWCELNFLCHEFDESFPDQYDDFEIARSFSKVFK